MLSSGRATTRAALGADDSAMAVITTCAPARQPRRACAPRRPGRPASRAIVAVHDHDRVGPEHQPARPARRHRLRLRQRQRHRRSVPAGRAAAPSRAAASSLRHRRGAHTSNGIPASCSSSARRGDRHASTSASPAGQGTNGLGRHRRLPRPPALSRSTITVTGPRLASDTSIMAPKRALGDRRPLLRAAARRTARTAPRACAGGAQPVNAGPVPLAAVAVQRELRHQQDAAAARRAARGSSCPSSSSKMRRSGSLRAIQASSASVSAGANAASTTRPPSIAPDRRPSDVDPRRARPLDHAAHAVLSSCSTWQRPDLSVRRPAPGAPREDLLEGVQVAHLDDEGHARQVVLRRRTRRSGCWCSVRPRCLADVGQQVVPVAAPVTTSLTMKVCSGAGVPAHLDQPVGAPDSDRSRLRAAGAVHRARRGRG